jgi:hypothetical protein
MLPKRFNVDRKCRKCFGERRTCRFCSRCQRHCRCEDGPPLIRRIELNGSACEFQLVKNDDDSFDLLVHNREGEDIVQFKDIELFHLEDVTQEVLLERCDSYRTLEVTKTVLKDLDLGKLESLFRSLPEDRLRAVQNVIHQVMDDSM